MKVELNKLPVKTTNHFHINECILDLTVPEYKGYQDLSIQGEVDSLQIEEVLKEETITSKIGLKFSKYKELKITIPKGVEIQNPILIDYIFREDDCFIDKIIIEYEEDSKCNFMITYLSADEGSHFHHLIEEVTSKKNSKGNITYINMMNQNSMNFIAMENKNYQNSEIIHNYIDIGGNIRVYNIDAELLEENSFNHINTIYVGNQKDQIDMNYNIKNIAKNTNSQIVVEGTIDEECQKTFRGTIDFIPGCENSIGIENENCILLSDNCVSKSLPQLLCGEENVTGAHGVSSGKISSEKLFYLMSRGYEKKDAERLIIMTNFHKIIKQIPSEYVQEFITNNIERMI